MEFDNTSIFLLSWIVIFVLLIIRDQSSRLPDAHPLLLNSQSDVARVRLPGESAVYRNKLTPGGMSLISEPSHTVHFSSSRVRTMLDIWQSAIEGKARFGVVEGDEVKYVPIADVDKRVRAFGSGLISLGVKSGDVVGLFMTNSIEYIVADMACLQYGFVSACIPTTKGQDLAYAIESTKMRVLIISEENVSMVKRLSEPNLQVIQVGDEFNNLEKEGSVALKDPISVQPSDTATICFTRGSTGRWKGAELTHGNIVAGVAGFLATLPSSERPSHHDIYLSFASLSHLFERTITTCLLLSGASIVLAPKASYADAQIAKPTIISSTPAQLVDFCKTHSNNKSRLFQSAYKTKLFWLREESRVVHTSVWDTLAFKGIKDAVGGKVRLVLTGSDTLSQDVLDFLRVTLGCPVLQGYGTAETAGGIALSMYNDYQNLHQFHGQDYSHIGPPLPNIEMKLIDQGEYTADDSPNPRGQIVVRGPSVMKGYYGDSNLTRTVFDKDGWLKTGDYGMMLPNGTLQYLGRIKT